VFKKTLKTVYIRSRETSDSQQNIDLNHLVNRHFVVNQKFRSTAYINVFKKTLKTVYIRSRETSDSQQNVDLNHFANSHFVVNQMFLDIML
jgi:hypothetical protein